MSSQDEDDSLSFEDLVDAILPTNSDGDPVINMDAFAQRLQAASNDIDPDEQGTDVNTAAVVVDAIQEKFPDAEVSLARSPESDVTVRVVVERDAGDAEDIESLVPQVVEEATEACNADVSTEVVQSPDNSADDDGLDAVVVE